MPEWLDMSQPRYTKACQEQQMSKVTRFLALLKSIRLEVKDVARLVIDQVVSSIETLYESVSGRV